MFRALARSVRRVDLTYFFIFLFYLVLNRVDALVCPPLEQVGYAHLFSWWTFMTLLVFIVSALLYFSSRTKQSEWYALFTVLLYVGGFLDALYIISVPFPRMWLDPNYIHYWHIAYILLHYPWTVTDQILWWVFWAIIIYVVYRRYRRKHKILKFLSINR
jgi:hypothetical protein